MKKLVALLSFFAVSASFACPNREMVETQPYTQYQDTQYQDTQYQAAPQGQMRNDRLADTQQDYADKDLAADADMDAMENEA